MNKYLRVWTILISSGVCVSFSLLSYTIFTCVSFSSWLFIFLCEVPKFVNYYGSGCLQLSLSKDVEVSLKEHCCVVFVKS